MLSTHISQVEWDARERVESSLAIKCPSVDYQLVGTKKIQQVLADPKILSRFCSPEDSALLFKCMAGIWALGTEADEAAKAERAKVSHDCGEIYNLQNFFSLLPCC